MLRQIILTFLTCASLTILSGNLCARTGKNELPQAIETGRLLYADGQYDTALKIFMETETSSQDQRVKSLALLEIGYVKFLQGFSRNTYSLFIRKALDLNPGIDIHSGFHKKFITSFNKEKSAIPDFVSSKPDTETRKPQKETDKPLDGEEITETRITEVREAEDWPANRLESLEEQCIRKEKEAEILRSEIRSLKSNIFLLQNQVQKLEKEKSALKKKTEILTPHRLNRQSKGQKGMANREIEVYKKRIQDIETLNRKKDEEISKLKNQITGEKAKNPVKIRFGIIHDLWKKETGEKADHKKQP